MNKRRLAVFVEGQTELVFVRELDSGKCNSFKRFVESLLGL